MQKDKNTGNLFFERNAETVNKLLNKYNELEDTRIDTPEIKENMRKIETAVNKISFAFEQELSNMYKNDMLDINAETEAFIQSLKNKGLLDNNK
jgi:chaperonin cofactor prefoldin